jgi:hypothetical protein
MQFALGCKRFKGVVLCYACQSKLYPAWPLTHTGSQHCHLWPTEGNTHPSMGLSGHWSADSGIVSVVLAVEGGLSGMCTSFPGAVTGLFGRCRVTL